MMVYPNFRPLSFTTGKDSRQAIRAYFEIAVANFHCGLNPSDSWSENKRATAFDQKFDFGYEIPNVHIARPANPEFIGERFLQKALQLIMGTLREDLPDLVVTYYSLSPLMMGLCDQHSPDDLFMAPAPRTLRVLYDRAIQPQQIQYKTNLKSPHQKWVKHRGPTTNKGCMAPGWLRYENYVLVFAACRPVDWSQCNRLDLPIDSELSRPTIFVSGDGQELRTTKNLIKIEI